VASEPTGQKIQQFLSEIPVRIKQGNTLTVLNQLQEQGFEERGFASASLADNIKVPAQAFLGKITGCLDPAPPLAQPKTDEM
jgi:hypothetical protein